MSQNFKLQFDENKEGVSENATHERIDKYTHNTNTRNLAFQWPSGRVKFYNYSYLVSCDFLPDDNKIILEFASEIVELIGTRLSLLAELLLDHTPRIIAVTEKRYEMLDDTEHWVITSITVKMKEGK